MKTNIDELKVIRDKTWKRAAHLEEVRKAAIRRLEKFPLWKRLFLFPVFNGLREHISNTIMERSGLVIMSLGMTRTILNIEKKLKEIENARNSNH